MTPDDMGQFGPLAIGLTWLTYALVINYQSKEQDKD